MVKSRENLLKMGRDAIRRGPSAQILGESPPAGEPAAETGAKPEPAGPPPAAPPERAQTKEAPAAPPAAGPSEQGEPAAEPASPASTEEDRVPVSVVQRLDQANKRLSEENKASQQRETELRAEINRLSREQSLRAAAAADKPDGFEEWSPDLQAAYVADRVTDPHLTAMQERIARMEAEIRDSRIDREISGLGTAQREAIKAVMDEFNGLSVTEAAVLAKTRDGSLFEAPQPQPAVIQPTHAVPAPAAGGEPRTTSQDPDQQDRQTVRKGTTTPQRLQAMGRIIRRGMTAKGLGPLGRPTQAPAGPR